MILQAKLYGSQFLMVAAETKIVVKRYVCKGAGADIGVGRFVVLEDKGELGLANTEQGQELVAGQQGFHSVEHNVSQR